MTDPTPPQPQTAEQVIAEVTERVLIDHRIVIRTRQPGYHGEWYTCESCDYDTYDLTAWEEHVAPFVAAEVVAALGLREEWTAAGADSDGPWIAQLNDYSHDEAQEYVEKHGGHLLRREASDWRHADERR